MILPAWPVGDPDTAQFTVSATGLGLFSRQRR
jgi:hypothetical protein